MTATPPKRPRTDLTGPYSVLRDGVVVTTLVITREWTTGGPRHTVTLADGRSESAGSAQYALWNALRLAVPGVTVIPWFDGAGERGWRIRAESERSPWDAQPQSEEMGT